MAKIKVKLYTLLREKTGKSAVEIEAGTVSEAIAGLKKIFGSKFTIGKEYLFVLNEETINKKDFKTKKIKEGECLHIFPPIAGGSNNQ